MDVHNKETRSYNMSHIRAGKTKPEEIVAKYLFSAGFRYRRNVKKLPGTPDIVLKKYKNLKAEIGKINKGRFLETKFIVVK